MIISKLLSRRVAVISLIAFTLLVFAGLSEPFRSTAQKRELAPEAAAITGRVFQDFNGNGTYDTTLIIANNGFGNIGVAIDRGISGVTVTAYDSSGVAQGSATSAAGTGTYTLNATGNGPYRLEFTTLPTGYQPSARSTDSMLGGTSTNSGSTVQFINNVNTADVNLALNYPTDYSQNNPEVVATMYAAGSQLAGASSGLPVLQSMPYSSGSTDTGTGATEANFDLPGGNPLDIVANQVGTTFGLAYARRTRLVYSGAYFKRHAGFGPQGPNAVYLISRTGSGSVSSFITVPGTATNNHNTGNYLRDNDNTGWDAVGKSSLGGIALSEDESILYVMNLQNRTLYALNSTSGAQLGSVAVPASLPLPSGSCPANDVRPFAVTMYHGQLYVGLVCSAESSTNADTFTDSNTNGIWDQGDYFIDADNDNVRDAGESYFELTGNGTYNGPEPYVDGDNNGVYNLGDARNLRAYVYTINTASMTYGASPVFQTPLNYRRGLATHAQNAMGAWRPWIATYRSSLTGLRAVYAQPMLTDIAFDNGNLILGLRDRLSDQVGNGSLSNPSDSDNTNFYQPRTAGDILRACGTPNSWTVESNGRCNAVGSAPQNVAEGPGGGEFYHGDAYDLSADFVSPTANIGGKGGNHDDTGNGGVEQLPGAPDVVVSTFDPIPNIPGMLHDGGLRWLSNSTGAFTKAYRMYDGDGNDAGVFGKAGGIGGSFTLLSDPAPIEIGNRVYRDTNSNGVQDPGEPAIAGVQVRLFSGSTVVGTAVTDANGEYYFVGSTSADGTPTDNIGQVNGGIGFNTAYQVRLDRVADRNTGGPLNGLLLTTANQTSQLGDDDSSDSDATNILNPGGSPSGTFPVISLTTGGPGSNDHKFDVGFVAAPTAAGVTVSGRVTTAEGNGIRNAMVYLAEADGTVHSTVTGSFGYFRFDDIMAGQTVVVSVSAKRFRFGQPTRVVAVTDELNELNWVANQ